MKNDYQFHINGLKGIKPYLQSLMLTTNYEGMGETDAKEIGETIDLAIEALEMRIPKKPLFLMDNPNYSPFDDSPEKFCGGPACHDRLMKNYPCKCGQMIDWSDT